MVSVFRPFEDGLVEYGSLSEGSSAKESEADAVASSSTIQAGDAAERSF